MVWFTGNQEWKNHYFGDSVRSDVFDSNQRLLPNALPAAGTGLSSAVRSGGLDAMRHTQSVPLPHGAPSSKRELGMTLLGTVKSGAADVNNIIGVMLSSYMVAAKYFEGRKVVKNSGLSKRVMKAKEAGIAIKEFDPKSNFTGVLEYKLFDRSDRANFVSFKGVKGVFKIPRNDDIPLSKDGVLVFEKGRFVLGPSNSGVLINEKLKSSLSKDIEGKKLLETMQKSQIVDAFVSGVKPVEKLKSKGYKELNTRLEYKGLFPSVDKSGAVVATHIFRDLDQGINISTQSKQVSRDVKNGSIAVGKVSPYNLVASKKGSMLVNLDSLESKLLGSSESKIKAALDSPFKKRPSFESVDTDEKVLFVKKPPMGLRTSDDSVKKVLSKFLPAMKAVAAAKAETKKLLVETVETKTVTRTRRR